jgi:hypothetical protein
MPYNLRPMDSPKSDYIRTLRRLPLFTDLSDVELAQIAEGEGDVPRASDVEGE